MTDEERKRHIKFIDDLICHAYADDIKRLESIAQTRNETTELQNPPTLDESLLPCPFCGEEGVMFEDLRYKSHPSDMYHVWGVECSNPECIMHQSQRFYPYEQAARRAWNKRVKR